ncbi:hypothetical protein R1sor_026372 [Riccia sorocarpa]|uniref:Uncharacterized protein n=1 Tax=Riccia sorocarpa TaxID=122646 RepID=A0ABD3GD99_9MARC
MCWSGGCWSRNRNCNRRSSSWYCSMRLSNNLRYNEWVMSSHHKRLFVEQIQQIKCPTGYGSNFRMAFTHEDTGTWGKELKTHDYHKLIQDIILIVIVDLDPCCRDSVLTPTMLISILLQGTISLANPFGSGGGFVRACPYALDVFCGAVSEVVEGYMKQHVKMEGSIAERYLIAETMFYGSETLARLDPSAPLNSLADKEDEREVGEVVFGKKTKRKLDPVTLTHAHTFILHNAERMQSWLEEYERERERQHVPDVRGTHKHFLST